MPLVPVHVVGFDDAPFDRTERGDIPVVGVVFSGGQFEGVMRTSVRRDGDDSAERIAQVVADSRYSHIQLIMLQGITLAGFNVVDIHDLHQRSGLPVVVVMRKLPDMRAIESALLRRVPGGSDKWALIQAAGAPSPAGGVYVQCAGIELDTARAVVEREAINGHLPEPLRYAHLIAAVLTRAESRGRP